MVICKAPLTGGYSEAPSAWQAGECGLFCRGAKSVADIDTVGPKSLLFDIFTMLPLLFLPPRGAKLHCQLRWGTWPDLPPWIRHWLISNYWLTKFRAVMWLVNYNLCVKYYRHTMHVYRHTTKICTKQKPHEVDRAWPFMARLRIASYAQWSRGFCIF